MSVDRCSTGLDVAADEELRLVAMHNDRSAFEMALKDRLPHLVAARYGENGKMFDLFFNDPRFRQAVVEYLGETYEEFRGQRVV